MATTYENIVYDRVVAGVKSLLSTEFGTGAIIYAASSPRTKGPRRRIRIWPLETEFIARPAGALTSSYPVEVVSAIATGGTQTVLDDYRRELASRAKRVLDNKAAYSTGGNYQWHGGTSNAMDQTDEGIRFIYTVLVTELL